MTTEYDSGVGGRGGEDDRVWEWELGLPSSDDLTPLSQLMIPPELASAFSISPEPYRTMTDVHRASRTTLSTIRGEPKTFEPDENGSDPCGIRGMDDGLVEDADAGDDVSKTLKLARLVWTPQLHKRFVEVVDHLGIKNAAPKTIMQLMNVEGLTRENVASHLQKYRLYLKRLQGLSNEGPDQDGHLFASTPVTQSLNELGGRGHVAMPVQMPYQMMHMPVISGHGSYPWMQQQQHGSVGSYRHHADSNDN